MMRRGSLRQRITLVVMTTTFAALLLSATALLIYELRSYRSNWAADLTTQAELVAQTSAAALTFDDARAARESLALLRLRPQIEAAAVYSADGKLFATYAAPGAPASDLPASPGALGSSFESDRLVLFRKIEQNGDRLGTVYLLAHYDVSGRLADYLAILAAVTLASLALAAAIFGSLERALTQPILGLAQAARDVTRRRDYRLQVEKTTNDEVGVLVDSFNDMLRDLAAEMEQRARAEEALRAADRRKDEFLATLAHELRNPLAPIVTGLEILKKPDTAAGTQLRARELMTRQLRQMVRLIDDLLDVSRITTNKLELHREPLDLAEIVREAIDVTEPLVVERGQRLSTAWPERPLRVDGDATRLTQVFVNLLNNAAKYTDRGGHIRVALEADGDAAVVRIADNGVGVDPALQAGIFEMFMQVDRSLERERAGLGVGLSLARRLVELHGGTVAIASEGVGRGSEFTVRLPALVAAEPARGPAPAGPAPSVPLRVALEESMSTELAPASAPLESVPMESAPSELAPPESAPPEPAIVPHRAPASAAHPPRDRRLDILVADDNVDLATSLADLLASLGHRVRVVHDGRAAIEAALAVPPDLALFDIGMPVLNGYDLARRLRAEPATRELVMVAITGWGQDTDRRQAREAGFDRHLVKPVEPEELIALLDSVVPRALAGAAGL